MSTCYSISLSLSDITHSLRENDLQRREQAPPPHAVVPWVSVADSCTLCFNGREDECSLDNKILRHGLEPRPDAVCDIR